MNVKEAVVLAKGYVEDLFAGDQVTDLGLEEVEFEDTINCWHITVSFSHPRYAATANNNPFKDLAGGSLLEMMREKVLRRSYKVVTINNNNDQVVSVKNREFQTAA